MSGAPLLVLPWAVAEPEAPKPSPEETHEDELVSIPLQDAGLDVGHRIEVRFTTLQPPPVMSHGTCASVPRMDVVLLHPGAMGHDAGGGRGGRRNTLQGGWFLAIIWPCLQQMRETLLSPLRDGQLPVTFRAAVVGSYGAFEGRRPCRIITKPRGQAPAAHVSAQVWKNWNMQNMRFGLLGVHYRETRRHPPERVVWHCHYPLASQ
jgi:hypothetical protein